MRTRSLDQLTDENLIQAFAHAAIRLGEAVINWESGAKETRHLFAIRDILRARGRQSLLELGPLLDDKNQFVQYYAARQLHALFPERCRQIVEENAKQGDAIAGDAGMHLYALDNGLHKPD